MWLGYETQSDHDDLQGKVHTGSCLTSMQVKQATFNGFEHTT